MASQTKEFNEHIWLVALYELESVAEELLDRLKAIGIDTSEATTVRVEIDDEMRATPNPGTAPEMSPISRASVTGALIGGAIAMVLGIVAYGLGLPAFHQIQGLFGHVFIYVISGAIIGAATGSIVAAIILLRPKKKVPAIYEIAEIRSEGFLVAVKMPPPYAEQAEEIARGLGAKQILL